MIISPAELVRNPAAPSSLFDAVFNGARPFPGSTYFHDNSGRGNHGTLTGYANPAAGWVWVPELGRWGIDCLGSTSAYVEVPHHSSLNTISAISISFWVYLTDESGRQCAFSKYATSGNNREFMFDVKDRGGLPSLFLGSDDGTTFSACTASVELAIDRWYHLIGTWPGSGSLRLFIDGIEPGYSDQDSKSDTIKTGVAPLQLGETYTTRPLRGYLADPMLLNASLDPAEIQWLANPANRLYVPDTRRVFVPTGAPPAPAFRPAWARRRQQTIGSGVI